MPKLSLKWPRDASGYHIEQAPRPGKTILDSGDPGPMIVRDGGPTWTYDPMEIVGLYRIFADCPPTEEGVRNFANKFGLLGKPTNQHPLRDFINTINVTKILLGAREKQDWLALELWMIDNKHKIRIHPTFVENTAPELFFQPATLKDAIYLQFFQDLEAGTQLRLCKRPGCGEWFTYGPGTFPPRRNTAQYCSPKCQKADAYAKTKKGKS